MRSKRAIHIWAKHFGCCDFEQFTAWWVAGGGGILEDNEVISEFCADADPRWCMRKRDANECAHLEFKNWSSLYPTADSDSPTPQMQEWARANLGHYSQERVVSIERGDRHRGMAS